MTAWYNESNAHAAGWLRNLISAGLICPGQVDDRDIRDVCANDLKGYTQYHFFAGIGIWSVALRMAGWSDDRPVTTGSCPCQPFSGAGKGDGFDDERHLWPAWHWLIGQYRPDTIFGEQVAGKDAGPWVDLVSSDLETLSYAFASIVLPVAGLGAPNERHRTFWVADAGRQQCREARAHNPAARSGLLGGGGAANWLGDAASVGRYGRERIGSKSGCRIGPQDSGRLGDAGRSGLSHTKPQDAERSWWRTEGRATEQPSGPSDPWRELEWIDCLDGKCRPTQPGLFPLAARNPGDVGRLRAYGNAISPQIAAEVIRAYLDCCP